MTFKAAGPRLCGGLGGKSIGKGLLGGGKSGAKSLGKSGGKKAPGTKTQSGGPLTKAGPKNKAKADPKATIDRAAQDPNRAREMVENNPRLRQRAQNADPQQLAKDLGISQESAQNICQACQGGGAAGAPEAAGGAEGGAGAEAGGEGGGLEGILGQIMQLIQQFAGAGAAEGEGEQGDLQQQVEGAQSEDELAQVLEQAGIQDIQQAPPEIQQAVAAKIEELQGAQAA